MAKKTAKKPARKGMAKSTRVKGEKAAPPGTATEELITRMLALIGSGASLRSAAEQCGIAASTALRAIDVHGLAEQYARAREERADTLAEEMIEIADNAGGDPQRDRLRLDARKWFASKLNPKKYGDRIEFDGNVGVRELTDEQIDQRLAAIFGGAAGGAATIKKT